MEEENKEHNLEYIKAEGTYTGVQESFNDSEKKETSAKKKPLGFGAGLGIGLGIGALVLVAAICVFAINGYNKKKAAEETILNEKAQNKINLIEQAIDQYYYDYKDDPATLDSLRDGAYSGIVESLEDPYSQYFTAEELEEEIADNQGVYYGIGAYISQNEDGYPVISSTMEDSPAEAADLRANDIIVAVDGESTLGLSLSEVVAKIKGEEGTDVTLTLYRDGEDDYIDITVTRGQVESTTVSDKMLEDNIGYIRITEFDSVTVSQFAECYQDILDQGATGLILDLRSNPGGLLNSVLEIGRQILPEGLIVYTEDKNGTRKEYACDGTNEIQIPLAVLVNGYSASASEILSGAIKDHGIGTLVGTTTYGKGIVQDTHMFSDGSAIKLTERAYFTPNGNYIQGTGIEPDVEVEFDADKYYNEGIDVQLNKAIEVIKGEE